MFHPTEDIRIQWTKVVLPPVFLEEELPVTEAASTPSSTPATRYAAILNGQDDRLLVLAGPCSIHDAKAAREYAGLLKGAIEEFSADLRIVMRVYFEKPRTTIGWKGLINDPHLDDTYKINDGLRLARHLLLDLAEMGVPTGTEFLDMISPQYIAGLVGWGAIGARTSESQVHRQLVSGVSCPVGFQERDLRRRAGGHRRGSLGGLLAYFSGPHATWPVGDLRHHGQSRLPHHSARRPQDSELHAECVADTAARMEKAGVAPRIMIDFSHANSGKDYRRQGDCLPRCCRANCRGQPQHHGRHDREQSGRRRAEARPRPAAGLRPKHHRRLHRLDRNAGAARRAGCGRARAAQGLTQTLTDKQRLARTTDRSLAVNPHSLIRTPAATETVAWLFLRDALEAPFD